MGFILNKAATMFAEILKPIEGNTTSFNEIARYNIETEYLICCISNRLTEIISSKTENLNYWVFYGYKKRQTLT